ncbi:hypothetical protein HK100_006400 [Physocladia obscura]|uniref:Uncharacterized protein n=1 Tax=Physocladia obscura TaxID=109957 RepID=A0AAD5SRU7_9FUNG|nr:hypothetical protein HK100_006400 [Physocladia obscura]
MQGLDHEYSGVGSKSTPIPIPENVEPEGKSREETGGKSKASLYSETESESWHGFVKNENCALLLGEAVAAGRLCVVRGPIRNGQLRIGGGTVLVLEDSTALSRWRDGMNWSASKKVAGFLLYRQVKVVNNTQLAKHAQVIKQTQFPPNKYVTDQTRLYRPIKSTALFHTGSLRPNTVLHPHGLAKRTIVTTTSSGVRFKIINYFYPDQVEHHFQPAGFSRAQNALDCPADLPEFRIFMKTTNAPPFIQQLIPNSSYDSATESPTSLSPPLNPFSHPVNSAMHLDFILFEDKIMNFVTLAANNGFPRSVGNQYFPTPQPSTISPRFTESTFIESQISAQYFNKPQKQHYSNYPAYQHNQYQPPYYHYYHNHHQQQQHQLQNRILEPDYSFETYFGFVKDKYDAMLIIEACVHGRLKCIPPYKYANLNYRSGSIVVITQKSYDTSSIRWRDGGNWTTSKLNDGFLLYRETESLPDGFSIPLFPIETVPLFAAGSLKANTQLIPGGMAKRTISLMGSDGNRYRVISYFYPNDVESHYTSEHTRQRQSFLKTPTEIPEFAVFRRHLPSTELERENSNGSVGEGDTTVSRILNVTTETKEELSHIVIPQQQQCNSACSCGGIKKFVNVLRYDLWDREGWFKQPLYLARINRKLSDEANWVITTSQQQ